MAISKWNPFGDDSDDDVPSRGNRFRAPFRQLQRDMNRIFEDFFDRTAPVRGDSGFPAPTDTNVRPRIDVSEDDETLKIRAELPGLDRDDIELEADDNGVTIKGEKSVESEDEQEGYYRRERSYGYFRRTIPFPVDVDIADATATFRDGLLDVRFPKKETDRGERLEIE